MKGNRLFGAALFAAALSCLPLSQATGQALSEDVEVTLVPNVGATFQTVALYNSYTSPVIVCTYNLASSADPSATVRMRNVRTTSFEIRLQQFENSSTVSPGDVHCLIVEEGVHTLSDGLEIEAHTVVSDQTSGLAVPNTWNAVNTERVDTMFGHTYTCLLYTSPSPRDA